MNRLTSDVLRISNCFVAEYVGRFPLTVAPHGNAVYNDGEYVRTQPEVLAQIRERVEVTKARPQQIYQEMKTSEDLDMKLPRNNKQVATSSSSSTDLRFYLAFNCSCS